MHRVRLIALLVKAVSEEFEVKKNFANWRADRSSRILAVLAHMLGALQLQSSLWEWS